MTKSINKLKRLSHLCKAIELELEDIHLLAATYDKEFEKDFVKENQFVIDKKEAQQATDQERVIETPECWNKIDTGPIKKLYRALARATHPDLTGDPELFKQIQIAYESGDVISLLSLALTCEIEVELTEKETHQIQELIDAQKASFEQIKSTISWAWALSDKDQAMRMKIQECLGIDPKEFSAWLHNQTIAKKE